MPRQKFRTTESKTPEQKVTQIDKWDGSPMGGFTQRPPDWCYGRLTECHGSTWTCSIFCARCSDQLECPAYQTALKKREEGK